MRSGGWPREAAAMAARGITAGGCGSVLFDLEARPLPLAQAACGPGPCGAGGGCLMGSSWPLSGPSCCVPTLMPKFISSERL